MVMMSFSMVTKSPDKVTSSIKPILADDWSLSRSGCTASQTELQGPPRVALLCSFSGQDLVISEGENRLARICRMNKAIDFWCVPGN